LTGHGTGRRIVRGSGTYRWLMREKGHFPMKGVRPYLTIATTALATIAAVSVATLPARADGDSAPPTYYASQESAPYLPSPYSNWAGYYAAHGSYGSVTASWTQPAISCGADDSAAAFWAGLDGVRTGAVEQAGVLAYCRGGTASYVPWWETYPNNAMQYGSDPVTPGDLITSTVTYLGGDSYEMEIDDQTAGWSEITDAPGPDDAGNLSAEVVAEVPTTSQGTATLADFGTVEFTNCAIDGYALGSWNITGQTMNADNNAQAEESGLLDDSTFDVTFQNA
jgi:hypothetical protein